MGRTTALGHGAVKANGLAALALWLSAVSAPACGFHDYTPDPTLVDHLLGSQHVVLARPDPAQPARFEVVEVLEGPNVVIDLPHRVMASTRVALAPAEDSAVLFARDGAYGPWQRLALLDAAQRDVVAEIVPRLPDWEMGFDRERFAFFAALLDHPSATLQDMALRELDRAPYAVLRELDLAGFAVDLPEDARGDLGPIRLLVAGIAGGPNAAGDLARALDRALTDGEGVIGAHAAAYIEAGGAEAAAAVAARLAAPDLQGDRAEGLVDAIALHAAEGVLTAPGAAARVLAPAVAARPNLAPAVARQFGQRGLYDLGDVVDRATRAARPTGLADLMVAMQYVALARGDVGGGGRDLERPMIESN